MGNPEKIGDIQPYAELFQGSTTTVYKGYQKSLERFVLLKVLRPEFSEDVEIARRFQDEAKFAAKVQHPNIVSIYSYGREGEHIYLATEFIEGYTLADLIARHRIPPNIASYVLFESTKGLRAAHDKGVLHRDIKPSNILISHDGLVKVTDFGMASFVQDTKEPEQVRGTMAYLAPELLLGEAPTSASDLFSLGATLYEMLLGEPAFKGEAASQYMDRLMNYDPIPLLQKEEEIPTQIRRMCQQLLRKKPQQRYQNCKVLIYDLEAFKRSRGSQVIGNAFEMKQYLGDPDGYKSPKLEKEIQVSVSRPKSKQSTSSPENNPRIKNGKTSAKRKQPEVKRIFIGVALVVLLFAGLSFAGSFFFNKEGTFGGRSSAKNPSAAPSESPSRITAQRGTSGQGNVALEADGAGHEGGAEPESNLATQPVKVIDESDGTVVVSRSDSINAPPEEGLTQVDSVVLVPSVNPRQTGRVKIDASPWAVVYFEGDSIGVTPLPVVVAPGTYRIELKNPNFPPFETLVDVVPGRETPVEVSLWAFVGTVQVEVFPFASVYINDVFIDDTPLERPVIIEPGVHSLTLTHPTLGSYDSSFEISAGEEKSLRFNLNDLR